MDKLVIVFRSAASRKIPAAEFLVKFTVRADPLWLTALPQTSCIWTVIRLELTPAVSVCGAVIMASLLGAPATTVNRPESVAVSAPEVARIVAVPAKCPVKVAL